VDDAWLTTVRIARDAGDISSLFPKGITRLVDLPHPLFTNISLALTFLKWMELPDDEQPPRSMWLDDEKITAWFREVKRNRENKMKGEDYGSMPQNAVLKEVFGQTHG
jgi:hypothetical protein